MPKADKKLVGAVLVEAKRLKFTGKGGEILVIKSDELDHEIISRISEAVRAQVGQRVLVLGIGPHDGVYRVKVG